MMTTILLNRRHITLELIDLFVSVQASRYFQYNSLLSAHFNDTETCTWLITTRKEICSRDMCF